MTCLDVRAVVVGVTLVLACGSSNNSAQNPDTQSPSKGVGNSLTPDGSGAVMSGAGNGMGLGNGVGIGNPISSGAGTGSSGSGITSSTGSASTGSASTGSTTPR